MDPVALAGPAIDASRSGSGIAIAAATIMLLVNALKSPALGALVRRIPARWRIALPIALGGVAGILSSVVGGVPWAEAVTIGLFSGPSAVFAHEAVVEALLGSSASRGADGG